MMVLELFDRVEDSHELRSVYGDPDYADRVAELEPHLAQLRDQYDVPAHGQAAVSDQ